MIGNYVDNCLLDWSISYSIVDYDLMDCNCDMFVFFLNLFYFKLETLTINIMMDS